MMKLRIAQHFKNIDLDVRKSKYSRFYDQKVQPDVLSAVAEAIVNCCSKNSEFSTSDIRKCDYSNRLVTDFFNKPAISKAENEYDKFFSQPIKMLAYSGLLCEKKTGQKYLYSISEYDILEYVSLSDRNANSFLFIYLKKVLQDSGLWDIFDHFFTIQNKNSLYKLREEFKNFLFCHTPIQSSLEPIRILNPLLNILSFNLKKQGTKSGKIAEINYNDVLYNRLNWRDVGKGKSISRKEFLDSLKGKDGNIRLYEYKISKAKKLVRRLHPYSEIHRYENYPSTQAHHIFPVNEFPEIADLPENIISLTANQHFYRAHPKNNTHIIDKSYQAVCLLAKLDSIENDYMNGSNYYDKNKFVEVINVAFKDNLPMTTDFEELKFRVIKNYI